MAKFASVLALLVASIATVESKLPEPSTLAADSITSVTVSYDLSTGQFDIQDGIFSDSGDAYARLYANVSGWYYLEAFAQQEVDHAEDAITFQRSLGFAEGYLTCELISQFYVNFYFDSFGTDSPTEGTLEFIKQNYDYMRTRSEKEASHSDYWFAVKQLVAQLDGLQEGYHSACPHGKLTEMDFLLLNAFGDLYDITVATSVDPEATMKQMHTPGRSNFHVLRCSSLVKLLPDLSDVVFGHTTWDLFISAAPRIFKRYSFPLIRGGHAEHHYDVYFSSSPGLLSSVDDFYVTRGYSKLAVIETTNEVLNYALYRYLTPNSLLSWARVMLANQLADDAFSWADVFSQEASGTYTDQWQILDLKKHTAGSLPKPGFFVVLEELPGHITSRDMTAALIDASMDMRSAGQGYWPSYNVPYFADIYERSGNAAACKHADTSYCYTSCARANIFRDKQATVDSLEDLMYLVQYNDWEHDPLSEGSPVNAIAARGDLIPDPKSRMPFGGIDGKVSSVSLSLLDNPVFYARLGPTTDDQPVFCWTAEFAMYPHLGHPECFDFDWTVMPPSS